MTRSNLKIVLRKSLRTQDMVLGGRVDGWLLIKKKKQFLGGLYKCMRIMKIENLQSFTTLVMVTKVHFCSLCSDMGVIVCAYC